MEAVLEQLLNIENEMEDNVTVHSSDIRIPRPILEEVKNAIISLKDLTAPVDMSINEELLKNEENFYTKNI